MVGHRPTRVLVAYSIAATYVSTTLDYLLSLSKFTDFEVRYVHVTHDAKVDFDLNEYDVLFHNYCARLCFEGYVSESYQSAVIGFRGLKILAVQDEYDNTAILHAAIRRLGFHVLLSCVPPKFWPLVYPKSEVPGVSIFHVLTGYFPERLLHLSDRVRPLAERPIPISYRGRDLSAKYGRLGFEKYEIGRRMIEECQRAGISHDIAMGEKSRIYGDAWFDFVGASRTMLGSESGSNIFDFDGRIGTILDDYSGKTGRKPTYLRFSELIDPIEERFDVGQISPRVFECALMRTPMILFRGSYSDIIVPDVHYIALEKDLSNAQDILSKIDDFDYLQGVADRAYDSLIRSGKYGYSVFAQQVQNIIFEQFPVWIDRNWIELRDEIEHAWPLPDGVHGSKAKHEYEELPTELPISSREEFYQRAAKTRFLGGQRFQTKLNTIASRFGISESLTQWLVQTAWYLLPLKVRYRFIRSRLAR